MDKSVLFVNPAYMYSFAMRDELRKLGWRADVYKGAAFPELFLNSWDYITDSPGKDEAGLFARLGFFARLIYGYKYFIVYGEPEVYRVFPKRNGFYASGFSPELALLKLLGKKVIFFPCGCYQEALRADYESSADHNICANCGRAPGSCDDVQNSIVIGLVNRYHDFVIANTPMPSKRVDKKLVKFLSLNLSEFKAELEIPQAYRLENNGKLKALHGFVSKGRDYSGKNIKGTPFVIDAVNRLAAEGYPVELVYFDKAPQAAMKFYQSQADIVVDQLIYGWWGSTSIEAMAMGKPVICHLAEDMKREFLRAFPEYDDLPVIDAGPSTIYEALKRLVSDENLRKEAGRKSREFAERHFDAAKNSAEIERLLLSL